MQHNLKLQSVIDSQFAQARPPPVVATASTTMHTRAEVAPPACGDRDYIAPTSKAAPAAKPSMPTLGSSSWTPTNPPMFVPSSGMRLGTDDEQEIHITYLNPDVFKGPMKVKVEPGSERPRSRPEGMADYGEGMRHARSARRERSPAPTQQYSPGDTGINIPPDFNDVPGDSGRLPGDDPPGDGDGDGDDDGNNPNFPPNDHGDDSKKTRRDKKKGKGPPGSGPRDGDDGNDPPSDDRSPKND